MKGNQTNYPFAYSYPTSEEYLKLLSIDSDTNSEDETSTNIADDENSHQKMGGKMIINKNL